MRVAATEQGDSQPPHKMRLTARKTICCFERDADVLCADVLAGFARDATFTLKLMIVYRHQQVLRRRKTIVKGMTFSTMSKGSGQALEVCDIASTLSAHLDRVNKVRKQNVLNVTALNLVARYFEDPRCPQTL